MCVQVTIGQRIGAGGQGLVYRGTYCGIDVALKEICYSAHDTTVLEDVRKEVAILGARVLARAARAVRDAMAGNVHHPSIVRLYGLVVQHPNVYV